MIKKKKTYLRLSSEQRPMFGPWNDVYATDIEKASTRQALKHSLRDELNDYYEESDDLDRFMDY